MNLWAPSKSLPASSWSAKSGGGGGPDVFLSYAREDEEFVEGRLKRALVAHGKNVWIDVENIRGGASDWRASVWVGIESSKVVVFVVRSRRAGSRRDGRRNPRNLSVLPTVPPN
jgi:hypothetical protein